MGTLYLRVLKASYNRQKGMHGRLTGVVAQAVKRGQQGNRLLLAGMQACRYELAGQGHEDLVSWMAPQAHIAHEELHDLCLSKAPASA